MAGNRRIFVVEDHATTARALKMYLQTQGYDVTVAEDVASALKFAKHNTFDLLVCDLSLPDGTGFELMQKLSADRPVRGIVFTASGNDHDIVRSKRAGFINYLVKGSSADELIAMIEDALKVDPSRTPRRTSRSKARSRNGTD